MALEAESTASNVTIPVAYRVAAGKSASPTYRIDVQYRPRVESLDVAVTEGASAAEADVTAVNPSPSRSAIAVEKARALVWARLIARCLFT